MKRVLWALCVFTLALIVGAGAVAFSIYDQYWTQLPPISRLLEYDPPVATRVYADSGELVGEFYFEKRYLTPIDQIPDVVRNAFVAAEDSAFYEHRGIDFLGIARAALANLRAGDVVQGGSTITQQVVKALLLTPERSYRRKLREAMLSLKLEREVSKDEILYLYLNQIYLGDGNYGIGAATDSYFGKKVADIGVAEAAMLAGLPKAPSRYSPSRNPAGALNRQHYVLRRMLEEKFISLGEYRTAMREGLPSVEHGLARAKVGSYYVEYVRRYLIDRFGANAPYHKGFRVHTGMNLELQAKAEDAVRTGIEKLDVELGYLAPAGRIPKNELEERLDTDRQRPELEVLEARAVYEAVVTASRPGTLTATLGPRTSQIDVSKLHWHPGIEQQDRRFEIGDLIEVTPVANEDGSVSLALTQTPRVTAALVSVEPTTGQVKAMVGGYDFAHSQFNRAVQAYRQPGSAFKPLVYAAALDSGYTPASIILDAPIQFVDHDRIWKPQNYSRRFYGPTTLRKALEHSRNVVTVRVVQDLGVDTVVSYVNKQFPFSRRIGRNLSVGLGTSEVTPLELTMAYSAFAAGGKRADPVFITHIEDADGNLVDEDWGQTTQAISAQTAYLISSMLEGVVQSGTGRSVRVLNRPVAGKTGTTNDQVDAWFVGYTPDLLTTVWVGYDDNRTLGPTGTGGRVAAPLWLAFMKEAIAGRPVTDFEMPSGIKCVMVDPDTGMRARADNMSAYLECFKEGTEPTEFTPIWRYDPRLGTEVLVTDERPGSQSISAPAPPTHDTRGQIFQ